MSNYIIGDLISRVKVGSKAHLISIKVLNTKISIKILDIFYENGLIRGYHINANSINVFLKYYKNRPVFFDVKLISTPGKKVYWSLNKLSLKYNLNTFCGFYIISTSKGLVTSHTSLLGKNLSGKILLKIYV
jgi:ribosomal protein S8